MISKSSLSALRTTLLRRSTDLILTLQMTEFNLHTPLLLLPVQLQHLSLLKRSQMLPFYCSRSNISSLWASIIQHAPVISHAYMEFRAVTSSRQFSIILSSNSLNSRILIHTGITSAPRKKTSQSDPSTTCYSVFGLQRWQGSVRGGENLTLGELQTIQQGNLVHGRGNKYWNRPRLQEVEHVVNGVDPGAHAVVALSVEVRKAHSHKQDLLQRQQGLHQQISVTTLMF